MSSTSIKPCILMILTLTSCLCSKIAAQNIYSTVDLLNHMEGQFVPLKCSSISTASLYYVNATSHKDSESHREKMNLNGQNVEAIYFNAGFNKSWAISTKMALGILPFSTIGFSPGGIRDIDIQTWLNFKFSPTNQNVFNTRFAIKLPIIQPEKLKRQVDIDVSAIYSKTIRKLRLTALLGYRHRFHTGREGSQDIYKYFDPGDEVHYKFGIDFSLGKMTRQTLFIIGHFSEDKIEYIFNSDEEAQTYIYNKPYKISIGMGIFRYFEGRLIFGKNSWMNFSILKSIGWKNELGGWQLAISIMR